MSSIIGGLRTIPFADLQAREPLPFVYEPAQLARFRLPDEGVDMIRHDHKSETFCAHPLQKHIQNTEQNTFGVLVVKLFTASIHRKRDEMHIMFVVNNFSPTAHTLTIRRPLELGKQNHQQSSHRHGKSSRLSNLLWRCHPGSRYRVNRGHPRRA